MPVFGAVLNLGCPLQYMYVLANVLLYNAFVFYDNVSGSFRTHFATLVSVRFVALKPFLFLTTPFWRCKLFLAYLAFCVHLHSFLVRQDACYGLLAFPFAHSFLVKRKVFVASRLL